MKTLRKAQAYRIGAHTEVKLWSRDHVGGDSPWIFEDTFTAQFAMRHHNRPAADREYRVYPAIDPNDYDVPTARALSIWTQCSQDGAELKWSANSSELFRCPWCREFVQGEFFSLVQP